MDNPYKVIQFQFSRDTENIIFTNPEDAIRHFNRKGWGMHNWNIQMQITDHYRSWTSISLLTFNLLTDNWESVAVDMFKYQESLRED